MFRHITEKFGEVTAISPFRRKLPSSNRRPFGGFVGTVIDKKKRRQENERG
jgi:hypothetical protein